MASSGTYNFSLIECQHCSGSLLSGLAFVAPLCWLSIFRMRTLNPT